MSQISLSYKSLELLAENSRRTSAAINTYISSIDSQTKRPCGSVTGPDDTGNVSSASSLAQSKMNELLDAKKRYDNFAKNVDDLADFAKAKDKAVADRIEEIADKYVGPRNWYQKAGDWIYNTFCVDTRNMGVVGKIISNIQQLQRWTVRKDFNRLRQIKDWFKYGDGKYVLEIGKALVGAAAAIVGCIAAVAAIPFDGGASIPIAIACIGAAATFLGTLITLFDTGYKIYGNGKALSKSGDIFKDGDADEGVARYYGKIGKYSDYTKKRDYGGEKENKKAELNGQRLDTAHTALDVVASACDILSLGNIRVYNDINIHGQVKAGKLNQYPINSSKKGVFKFGDKVITTKGYDLSKENVLKNIRREIGLNVKGDKWLSKPTLKNTIIKNDKIAKYTITLKNGKKIIPKAGAVKVFNIVNSLDNINKVGSLKDTLLNLDGSKGAYSIFKDVEKVAGKFKPISAIDKFAIKPTTKVIDFGVSGYKEIKTRIELEKVS